MAIMRGLAKLEAAAALTMALVFGVVAGILGLVLWFSGYSGGSGIMLALVLSVVLMAVQWWFSPYLIKLVMHLEELKPGEQPGLRSTVEKLAKEAVLAHEVGHIKHRDVIVMTVASVLPVLLYYIVLAMGSRDRENRQSSALLVFLGAMFARFLGSLLVMWLSRTREYYADEFSARVTRKPASLMNALSKITYGIASRPSDGGAVRAFYIADPEASSMDVPASMSLTEIEAAVERDKAKGLFEIFMTHPLTSKRLLNLKRVESEI